MTLLVQTSDWFTPHFSQPRPRILHPDPCLINIKYLGKSGHTDLLAPIRHLA
jgi:hypothetical protein